MSLCHFLLWIVSFISLLIKIIPVELSPLTTGPIDGRDGGVGGPTVL